MKNPMEANRQIHIVVLGAGFGGLTFCKQFQMPGARITLVDRTNHHLFQPLLYQVATCGLSAPDIAQPVRSIMSDRPDVTVLLDNVTGFDFVKKQVRLKKNSLSYDYPEWERFAPGLKSLEDALRIRSHVLLSFEQAENEANTAEHDKLMTIVVVGGGPTGVELAGSFAELTRTVLKRDFRRIDPTQARIILIEASKNLLSNFPPDLSASARRQLEALGVQVRNETSVKDIREGEVELASGEIIPAANVVWAAGVSATQLTQKLGVELDRAGRVKVNPDLSLPGHLEIFAIGDMAFVPQADGKPVPGVSPAAIQMAAHVAKIIEQEAMFAASLDTRPAFKYWDKGTMATIGRSAAVAWIGKLKFSGLLAWLAWLFVHLIFLIGFRNRTSVFFQWAYSYFSYNRSARLITNLPQTTEPQKPAPPLTPVPAIL